MKTKLFFLILAATTFLVTACTSGSDPVPRVFVFTDINIDAGDPDDRQSLIHLLWYADELNIEGIVPDRWYAGGFEACILAVEAYAKDFDEYDLGKRGYPDPSCMEAVIATDLEDAIKRFHNAASDRGSPLYVLIWGNMANFGEALRQKPELADNIRLITIGTGLMMEEHRPYIPENWELTDKPCDQPNWNGEGRNRIYNDSRFNNMWWLEINWTYEGMFSGNEPYDMFEHLTDYGALGLHMWEVVESQPWAHYFRVGDTPSVLYVIDPDNNLDDPTAGSWAGKFVKPLPDERPYYYTDSSGPVEWDYSDPCNTWENHVELRDYARSTLEKVRPAMYQALLDKLSYIYGTKATSY